MVQDGNFKSDLSSARSTSSIRDELCDLSNGDSLALVSVFLLDTITFEGNITMGLPQCEPT